jgi:hypothetical protein
VLPSAGIRKQTGAKSASENSFTRRCRILHKIGRSEAWIRPPEPQDLASELVGSLRGDSLVNTSYERLLPLDLDLHKNAGCCGVSAETQGARIQPKRRGGGG